MAPARQGEVSGGRLVPAHDQGGRQVRVLGGDQAIGPGYEILQGTAVQGEETQGVGDRKGVLRGGDPFAHGVDHGHVKVAGGQDHPVVEIAAGECHRVGSLVVDAQLGVGNVWHRGADRLLQVVHRLPVRGLRVGQESDGPAVLESHPEVGRQRHDDGLGLLFVGPRAASAHEQDAVARPCLGGDTGHGEALDAEADRQAGSCCLTRDVHPGPFAPHHRQQNIVVPGVGEQVGRGSTRSCRRPPGRAVPADEADGGHLALSGGAGGDRGPAGEALRLRPGDGGGVECPRCFGQRHGDPAPGGHRVVVGLRHEHRRVLLDRGTGVDC